MSKFNEDELNAPNWMDKNFFSEVLRKYEKSDTILVNDVKISPASAQGDHYSSIMFRASVTYDTPKSKGITKSLIIKTMPEVDGPKKELFAESHIFETEISMYSETIPKIEAELRKIGDNTSLGAEALYYSLEPRKVIIFEDICTKAYEVLRDRDCNMEEIKAAYLKLAKWHAVSYKLAAEGDTSISSYKESFLAIDGVEEMPCMTSGIENFIEKLETIDDLKKYVPKLREIQKNLLRRSINSFKYSQEKGSQGIFVLCHGDFHRRNMMFKNNSNSKFEDVKLLDFQYCYYGPAILDVLYGIYMLADSDMRANKYDEIIHYYASSFIECLEKLKFPSIPKVSDFFIEVLRHKHWELLLMTSYLPNWNAIGYDDFDFNEIMTCNEVRKKAYDRENYINEVRTLLPRMFFRGYLEESGL